MPATNGLIHNTPLDARSDQSRIHTPLPGPLPSVYTGPATPTQENRKNKKKTRAIDMRIERARDGDPENAVGIEVPTLASMRSTGAMRVCVRARVCVKSPVYRGDDFLALVAIC